MILCPKQTNQNQNIFISNTKVMMVLTLVVLTYDGNNFNEDVQIICEHIYFAVAI